MIQEDDDVVGKGFPTFFYFSTDRKCFTIAVGVVVTVFKLEILAYMHSKMVPLIFYRETKTFEKKYYQRTMYHEYEGFNY